MILAFRWFSLLACSCKQICSLLYPTLLFLLLVCPIGEYPVKCCRVPKCSRCLDGGLCQICLGYLLVSGNFASSITPPPPPHYMYTGVEPIPKVLWWMGLTIIANCWCPTYSTFPSLMNSHLTFAPSLALAIFLERVLNSISRSNLYRFHRRQSKITGHPLGEWESGHFIEVWDGMAWQELHTCTNNNMWHKKYCMHLI